MLDEEVSNKQKPNENKNENKIKKIYSKKERKTNTQQRQQHFFSTFKLCEIINRAMVCVLYFVMIKLKFIENQKGMTTQPRDLNFNNFSVTKKKLRYDQAKEILTLFLLLLLLWLLLFFYRSTIKRSMSSLYFISNEKMFKTTPKKTERRNFLDLFKLFVYACVLGQSALKITIQKISRIGVGHTYMMVQLRLKESIQHKNNFGSCFFFLIPL